tara:strand:- start:786 stop:1721 length:936 start_codon:yes stop_codon:yes gene_type:complete
MKQISIDFRNMWGGFFKHDNIITNTLSLEYDVVIDEQNPDMVICQNNHACHGTPPPKHFVQDRIGKSKIVYWLVESIDRTGLPDYSECDYSFSSCQFDDPRNVRIPLWAMYVNWFGNKSESYVEGRNQAFLVSPNKLLSPQEYTEKKKFCCILTNNDMNRRKEDYPKFVSLGVENGLLVESRGRYLTNMPPIGNDEKHKLEYIDEFKFNLCYDNGESLGWVTEKLIHPIYQGSIPIYWGCPNVSKEFNKDRFISARNYQNMEHLFDSVLQINSDKNLFEQIQHQPCFPENKIPDCANPEHLIEKFKKIVDA